MVAALHPRHRCNRHRICRPYLKHLKCLRRWLRSHQLQVSLQIIFKVIFHWLKILVPTMLPISSSGLQISAASTVITTSNSGMVSMNSHNYPQLTPLPTNNNHLFQQSSLMNSSDLNQSPTCFQTMFPNALDLIKMENGSSPHIAHTNLARALSGEAEKNNNKVLDLELKKNRQTLASLTNIESR